MSGHCSRSSSLKPRSRMLIRGRNSPSSRTTPHRCKCIKNLHCEMKILVLRREYQNNLVKATLLTKQTNPTSVTSQHQLRRMVPRVGQAAAMAWIPESSMLLHSDRSRWSRLPPSPPACLKAATQSSGARFAPRRSFNHSERQLRKNRKHSVKN